MWWWSYLLTFVGVTGLYFAGHNKAVIGWSIGVAAQGLWLAYALTTHQYGFLLSVPIYGAVFISNLRKALDERRA